MSFDNSFSHCCKNEIPCLLSSAYARYWFPRSVRCLTAGALYYPNCFRSQSQRGTGQIKDRTEALELMSRFTEYYSNLKINFYILSIDYMHCYTKEQTGAETKQLSAHGHKHPGLCICPVSQRMPKQQHGKPAYQPHNHTSLYHCWRREGSYSGQAMLAVDKHRISPPPFNVSVFNLYCLSISNC